MMIAEPASTGETLVLDVETQKLSNEVGGWSHIRDMRLAVAVVQCIETAESTCYLECDVESLVNRLRSARLVVGFNLMRFDYEVLLAYTSHPLRTLPTVDIMLHLQKHLGFRPHLADVAKGTLEVGKSADGVQSVEWFRQGLIDKVIAYCQEDVRLTAEIYAFGRAHDHVLVQDRYSERRRVPVRW
jgi:DEAD/DEAH box helicase domain-containing protein